MEDLKEVILSTGGTLRDLKESKASERLMKHVHKLISQADSINQKLLKEKVQLLEQIEVSEVRVKRSTELKDDVEKLDKVMKDISRKKLVYFSLILSLFLHFNCWR